MVSNTQTKMTLANIIKFLEPTTLEVKTLMSGALVGLVSYPFLENTLFTLAIGPLATLPLYLGFRFMDYKLRNEKLDNPNRPKKILSEYLANIDFSPERDYP